MMKTIVRSAVLLLLCAGACGGQTDGRSPVSGLVSEEPVFELSASELQQLCDWISEELGGAATDACDRGTIETLNVVCEGPPPSCVALVGDVEACAREQREALEACEVGEDGPACARLARLCPAVGTIDPGMVLLPGCVPGSTRECTCTDGAQGAQICSTDELWDGCACESVPIPPSVCTPGETVLCACTDGAMGAQLCDASGQQWLPCDCHPPAGTCNAYFCPAPNGGTPCCVTVSGPCGQNFGTGCVTPTLCVVGETRACSCANGALGAEMCDGQQWLPCDCRPPGGTCDAAFCPAPIGATPCCVTANGPCGQDFGTGCVSPIPPGAD